MSWNNININILFSSNRVPINLWFLKVEKIYLEGGAESGFGPDEALDDDDADVESFMDDEVALMYSMQALTASVLWESKGAATTNGGFGFGFGFGFGLTGEDDLGEVVEGGDATKQHKAESALFFSSFSPFLETLREQQLLQEQQQFSWEKTHFEALQQMAVVFTSVSWLILCERQRGRERRTLEKTRASFILPG